MKKLFALLLLSLVMPLDAMEAQDAKLSPEEQQALMQAQERLVALEQNNATGALLGQVEDMRTCLQGIIRDLVTTAGLNPPQDVRPRMNQFFEDLEAAEQAAVDPLPAADGEEYQPFETGTFELPPDIKLKDPAHPDRDPQTVQALVDLGAYGEGGDGDDAPVIGIGCIGEPADPAMPQPQNAPDPVDRAGDGDGTLEPEIPAPSSGTESAPLAAHADSPFGDAVVARDPSSDLTDSAGASEHEGDGAVGEPFAPAPSPVGEDADLQSYSADEDAVEPAAPVPSPAAATPPPLDDEGAVLGPDNIAEALLGYQVRIAQLEARGVNVDVLQRQMRQILGDGGTQRDMEQCITAAEKAAQQQFQPGEPNRNRRDTLTPQKLHKLVQLLGWKAVAAAATATAITVGSHRYVTVRHARGEKTVFDRMWHWTVRQYRHVMRRTQKA